MLESDPNTGTIRYRPREVVGILVDPAALEAAVDELEISGFDRAAISVLASDQAVKDRVGRLYRSSREVEDDRHAPQAAFISSDSRTEGEAAAVGVPLDLGSGASALAVIAMGGTLAAAIAAAVAGGAAGVGIGAVLAFTIARSHRDRVAEELSRGGSVLWVGVRDRTAEQRALGILKRVGAADLHVHEVEREWTLKDRPLSEIQPDPFLEHNKN